MQAQTLQSLENEELELVLAELARMRIRQLTSPVGIKLQRIVSAESRRFLDIFLSATELVTKPVVTFLSGILRRHVSAGIVVSRNPDMAATAFLSMAVGAPARIAASGNKIDEAALEDRIAFTVELFLNGLHPR